MQNIFLFLLVIGLYSCGRDGKVAPAPNKDPAIKIHIFMNDTLRNEIGVKGYGYDILQNGALFIHQPVVPAVAGNRGFSSASDAQKAAEFVVYKIAHGIMPPSVSYEELDSIGVLHQQ